MADDPVELLPRVYQELRALAACYFRGRTVHKDWRKARAWLLAELQREPPPS